MNLGDVLLELEVPEHRPGFFDDLRGGLGHATGASRPRLLLVAAAAAIVAGTLAFGLTRGSEVASAAQVQAAVEHALASTGSISGVLIAHNANSQPHDGTTQGAPIRFVLSSTGAYRIVDSEGSQLVYDPARNTETFSDHSEFVRIVGVPPGPPDMSPLFFVPQLGLGSVVATLADARDPTVENVTYEGRPAWLLRWATGSPGEQAIVTVDRATGMPVRDQLLRDGRLFSELRLDQLRVSANEPRITLPVPKHGQSVQTVNLHFRSTSLAGAGHAAGYAPLVPKRLPHGFRLAAIGFAPSAQTTGGNLLQPNPLSRDVVSVTYRRGLDEIIVTTRRTVRDPSAWEDPFQTTATPTPSHVTFTGGALAGDSGYLVISPTEFPHVWTAGPKLVVTVAGTVGRAELLEVANSLHVAG